MNNDEIKVLIKRKDPGSTASKLKQYGALYNLSQKEPYGSKDDSFHVHETHLSSRRTISKIGVIQFCVFFVFSFFVYDKLSNQLEGLAGLDDDTFYNLHYNSSIAWIRDYHQQKMQNEFIRKKTLTPTLLHVKDHQTGKSIDAMNHLWYDIFKNSEFKLPIHDEQREITQRIWLNKHRVSFGDSLKISILDKNGEDGLQNTDIVTFHCSSNLEMKSKSNARDASSIYESFHDLATIQQIRFMSKKISPPSTTPIETNNEVDQNLQKEATMSFLWRYSDPNVQQPLKEALEASSRDILQWEINSFPIIHEENCNFRLWRNRTKSKDNNTKGELYNANRKLSSRKQTTFELMSYTDPVKIQGASTKPTSIHLAYTNNFKEINIQFMTGGDISKFEDSICAPVAIFIETSRMDVNDDEVKTFRKSKSKSKSKSKWYKIIGDTSTYTADDMCGAPANITNIPGNFKDPGLLHSVTLTDLEFNTRYSYKVGISCNSSFAPSPNVTHKDGNEHNGVIWSDTFAFVSAPEIGSGPVSMLAYADQGSPMEPDINPGAYMVNQHIQQILKEKENHDVPIYSINHIGDLSYAIGAAHIWDEWQTMIEPIVARIPFMVGIGNHEYDWIGGERKKDPSRKLTDTRLDHSFEPTWGNFGSDSGGECGVPTAKRFATPTNGNGVFWYSYDVGIVHTIMISSEHNLTRTSEQYKWLEQDLKSVNRNSTPFVIVQSHRPLYNSIVALYLPVSIGMGMQLEFEDLLKEYQVDFLLSGHYHSYLRTCPGLYRWKCNNGGPLHITIGTAGRSLIENTTLFPQNWTDVHIPGMYGFGKVTAINKTSLLWEFFNSETLEVLDSIWVKL